MGCGGIRAEISHQILKKDRKEEKTMPNGNGQGPGNAGAMTGRGRGFCSGSGVPGRLNNETSSSVSADQPQVATSVCRGPQKCGTGPQGGMKSGQGRRSGGCGNRRGQQ